MTKLAFEIMGDPFLPFIYGQQSLPFQIANNYEIPLIMYGENGVVEYEGMNKYLNESGFEPSDESVNLYLSGFHTTFWKKFGLTDQELKPYNLPSLNELRQKNIVARFFSYYEKWIPQENYYHAAEHCGFQANPDGRSEGTYSKYAGLDDKLDGFHYYLAYIKFGLGRAMSDAVHEVRDGHISREEAVALITKYNGEFPARYFKDFLDYIDISEEKFFEILNKFRSSHLWEKVDDKWQLKVKCH